jgi:hypothetical protein
MEPCGIWLGFCSVILLFLTGFDEMNSISSSERGRLMRAAWSVAWSTVAGGPAACDLVGTAFSGISDMLAQDEGATACRVMRMERCNSMATEREFRGYMTELSKSPPSLVWQAEQLLTPRDVKGTVMVIILLFLASLKARQKGMTGEEDACKEEKEVKTKPMVLKQVRRSRCVNAGPRITDHT